MEGRATFDTIAELYDRIRPSYPEALFDDLLRLTGLSRGAGALEIGCGTGQATRSLAKRGLRISCLELGAQLAKHAARNLSSYPNVSVRQGDFETVTVSGTFDLIFSATAFHWLSQEARYTKTAHLLKQGGFLAPFWNVHVFTPESGGFFEEVQEVYLKVTPEQAKTYKGLPHDLGKPRHQELGGMPASGLFTKPELRSYPWTASYSAAEYLDLLNTYSDHRSLPEDTRAQLFESIANLIEEKYGGNVVKGYLSVLYVGKKL